MHCKAESIDMHGKVMDHPIAAAAPPMEHHQHLVR